MNPTLRYWRDLFILFRTARQNPIIVSSPPRKMGWIPRLFFHLQLFAVLAAAGFVWTVPLRSAGESELVIYGVVFSVLVAPFSTLLTFPLNLLVCASRWNAEDRMNELAISRLSAKEVAFGSIFWGMVTGCIVPFGALLIGFVALLGSGEFRGSSFDKDELVLIGAVYFILISSIFMAAAVMVRMWFRLRLHRWPILFTGPVVAFLWGGTGFFLIVGWTDVAGSPFGDFQLAGGACIIASVITILALRSAGKFAPSLFFRPIAPHLYEDASVIGNMRAHWRDRESRAKARAAAKASVRIPWITSVGAFAAVLLLFALLYSMFLRVGQSPLRWFNLFSILAAIAAATTITLALEARREGGLAFVGGALDTSLLRRLLPISMCAVAVIVGSLFAQVDPYDSPVDWTGYLLIVLVVIVLIFLWCIGLLFANAIAVAWWLPAGKARIPRLIAYLGFPILLWSLAARSDSAFDGGTLFIWPDWSDTVNALLVVAGIVLIHRSLVNFQRLYDATVRGAPAGEAVRLNLWTGRRVADPPPPTEPT